MRHAPDDPAADVVAGELEGLPEGLGDPTGRWLLVANQRSDSVVVFGRDPENGRLTPTRPPQRIAIPSPVCLGFLAPPLPH